MSVTLGQGGARLSYLPSLRAEMFVAVMTDDVLLC